MYNIQTLKHIEIKNKCHWKIYLWQNLVDVKVNKEQSDIAIFIGIHSVVHSLDTNKLG